MDQLLPEKDRTMVRRILDLIRRNQRFLISSHNTLDGDAVSAELALASLVRKAGKDVRILNQDPVPAMYRFLPGAAGILTFRPSMRGCAADVVFILDCGVLDRIGKVHSILPRNAAIVNIDHHFRNERFGDFNWISPSACSCGEMIYHLIRSAGPLDRRQAMCLYTSILTDTGGFLYNLGSRTFALARILVDTGIDPQEIATKVYFERSFKSMRLFSLALATLSRDRATASCWLKIRRSMLAETGTEEQDTEGFIDYLRKVKGAAVVFLLKEKQTGVKVSFRGRAGRDVERIARSLGGGGHREASGCFLEGVSLEEAEDIVLERIRRHGRNHRRQ